MKAALVGATLAGWCMVSWAPLAYAWGHEGHMAVADIAWQELEQSPPVRGVIEDILDAATANFAVGNGKLESYRDAFAYAATFPDFIKSDTHSAWEPVIDWMNSAFWPNQEVPEDAGREGVRCKSWHFYDTPIGTTQEQHIWESNAIVALQEATLRLKQLNDGNYDGPEFDGVSHAQLKFWWLAWILHLTGDLHQPLHCVANYNVPGHQGESDAGGNLFVLAGGRKLHGLWDGLIVSAAQTDQVNISEAERMVNPSSVLAQLTQAWAIQQVDAGRLAVLDPAAWVAEGAEAAKAKVYKGIKVNKEPSKAYMQQAHEYARGAAVLAGKRLASVLEATLN